MKYRLRTPALSFVVGLVIALGIISPTVMTQQVGAASAGDWRAGNIIDDSLFYNGNDMSAGDIQAFLNSKVPVCDTWGTKTSEFGGGTRAQYGASQGYPAPYTCLKDYSQSIPGYSADAYCGAIGAGAKSAAQIIKDVSQACGIGSRVLLVLLQKEQSLITDEWPWSNQYQKATGFACPDTAPCDSQYAGYFNQVYRAARQYKVYRANPNNYGYKARQNNTVRFNPNIGCGSSNVYIENDATAGLYIYTPYQPNQAALNNLYGSGDGCSAYGNRNFWRMYTDWFGSTRGGPYVWQLNSQSVFTDETKSQPSGLNNLSPSQKVYAVISIKNIGSQTWYKSGSNPFRLGTSRPYERISRYCDTTWLSCSRPAGMTEEQVAPGQNATFQFWLKMPVNGGTVDEYFTPVAEGRQWLQDIGMFYRINSTTAHYTWQMTSQYAYTDQTKTTVKNMASLNTGEKVFVGFTARNTGNTTWYNSGPNALMVGTLSPHERSSRFSLGSDWITGTRPALLKELSVAPGQIGTFEFWMTAPVGYDGIYNERFGLIANDLTWLNDVGLSYYAGVKNIYTWQMASQYAFTDETKTTARNMANLSPLERVYVGFTARNTGNVTWRNSGPNALMVGTASPYERRSAFSYGSNWLTGTRPALLKEASVAPGQVGTFEFWMTAPATGGTYNERFNLIANDITWLNDVGLSYYANSR